MIVPFKYQPQDTKTIQDRHDNNSSRRNEKRPSWIWETRSRSTAELHEYRSIANIVELLI